MVAAAPTGSGKTWLADYLAADCLAQGKQLVYVAPIKSLGNQRFRDWFTRFGDDVGIITGDVCIRPEAAIRVVTTETLRNMLLDEPADFDAVDTILLDDLHLLNGAERGSVWEESFLFSPTHLRFVCLMLPAPNLQEFAHWLEQVREHPVTLVSRTNRSVPLEHFCFIPRLGISPLSTLTKLKNATSDERRYLLSNLEADVIQQLVEQDQLPCVYFCHSRRRCEDLAFDYAERELFDPNPDSLDAYDERCDVYGIAHEEDALLLRETMAQGIAYHHAGMLPRLRYVVESLFADGLISLVFATEGWATGAGLEARSVVLDHLTKFDGVQQRTLKPEEFDQIAGRAGRYGIDEQGTVITCVRPIEMTEAAWERIAHGDHEPLDSCLAPGYATILHLYERYGKTIETWIEKSFRHTQAQTRLQKLNPPSQTMAEEELLPVECIYDHPEWIEEYQRLSEALAQAKMGIRKQQRQLRKARGRGKMRARMELEEIGRILTGTEQTRRELACTNCPHKGECMLRSQKLGKAQRQATSREQRRDAIERIAPDEIRRKLALLESVGAIKEERLTFKGQIMAALYGCELPVGELLSDGYFDRFDEVQINVLVAALCFESRDGVDYTSLDRRHLGFDWEPIRQRLQRLTTRQQAFGITPESQQLDIKLSSVVNAWSKGSDFSSLMMFTDASEGDLIRSLRRVISLLAQIDDALPEALALHEKLSECIDLMNRDLVDPEQELLSGLNVDQGEGFAEVTRG